MSKEARRNLLIERLKTSLDKAVESGGLSAEEAAEAIDCAKMGWASLQKWISKANPKVLRWVGSPPTEKDEKELFQCLLDLYFLEHPPRQRSAMEVFAEELKARQGTFMPDFASLHQKKEQLDRKFFGAEERLPDQPDS